MSNSEREFASKLCANALPIVFSACEGGRYRTWALNLLAVGQILLSCCERVELTSIQRYLDIGETAPIKWVLRCGIFEILPSILNWKSSHEASVAIFLLQRLMLSEKGPQSLVQPHPSLHKPPITLLSDFLAQHLSGDAINISSDTFAGILYVYTKAIQDAKWTPSEGEQSQWKQIFSIGLSAQDSLVRSWTIFALATCHSLDCESKDKIYDMAITDSTQSVRMAAAFAVWHWHDPRLDSEPSKQGEDTKRLGHLADHIYRIGEDASYHVRTTAYGLAMEWVSRHQEMVLKQMERQATALTAIGGIERDSLENQGSRIIATLARGSDDPLNHLKEAMEHFLLHTFKDARIGNCPLWRSSFPNLPAHPEPKDGSLMTMTVSRRYVGSAIILIAISCPFQKANDPQPEQASSSAQRPLASQILAWRQKQERYFHVSRLTVCASLLRSPLYCCAG